MLYFAYLIVYKFTVLLCVGRHQGIMPSTEIEFSVKTNESNSLEYCMSLGGSHLVTGSCASKKEGKQLAAQALLQVQQL